jgi:hypothetical protein
MRRQMRAVKDTVVRPGNVCQPRYAIKKARNGIPLTRWELGGIADSPSHALEYARHVAKGRWEPGEAAIKRNSNTAYCYACVLGSRWEEGEEVISSCAHASLGYATDIVRGRWELGEAAILGEFSVALKYVQNVVRGRWAPLEEKILSVVRRGKKWRWESSSDVIVKYLKAVGRPRWPELEAVLMEKNRAKTTYLYAVLTGCKLNAELHQKMMMFSFDDKRRGWSKRYLRFLESCERRAIRYLEDLDPEARREFISRIGGVS